MQSGTYSVTTSITILRNAIDPSKQLNSNSAILNYQIYTFLKTGQITADQSSEPHDPQEKYYASSPTGYHFIGTEVFSSIILMDALCYILVPENSSGHGWTETW